jgi:hypothetical protein
MSVFIKLDEGIFVNVLHIASIEPAGDGSLIVFVHGSAHHPTTETPKSLVMRIHNHQACERSRKDWGQP